MAGQITHALERGGQSQRGDDHAQIGGHRVLLGQQLHALVDDARLERIDLDIAVDDGLGGFKIRVQQRVARAVDRLAHILHHAIEVIGNGLELLVENNAHCSCLSWVVLYNLNQCNIFGGVLRTT